MKKVLLIAIVIVASLNLMNAQGIHFGATAGVNLASVSDLPATQAGQTAPTTSMIIGFHAGAVVNIGLNDSWSVEPSLLYFTCGVKQSINYPSTTEVNGIATTTTTAYTQSATDNFSYIQIPIVAKYKLGMGLNFFAGPYFGLLLSGKENYDGYSYTTTTTVTGFPNLNSTTTSTAPSGSYNLDSGSVMSSMDIGLRLGVGFDLPMGLGFTAGYDMGLTTLFKSQTYGTSPNTYTEPAWGKNGVITISIRYLFGIGS